MSEAVYGNPLAGLARPGAGAIQVSPLVAGAEAIETLEPGSLDRFVILAPPGVLERRYLLAHALRALKAGGELVALAPKVKGGARIGRELAAFGCEVREAARRHHRICHCDRPAAPAGIEGAISEGSPQYIARLGLWSQPGIFSWDRLDPGSALLIEQAWRPAGAGADLGCGVGVLALNILKSTEVTRVTLVDVDARAIAASRRNVADTRAAFLHTDLRADRSLRDLDFVIMNPPFHDGGAEDRALGRTLVNAAAAMLRNGGVLRMVANVALPYEDTLAAAFREARQIARANGYKVFEAIK